MCTITSLFKDNWNIFLDHFFRTRNLLEIIFSLSKTSWNLFQKESFFWYAKAQISWLSAFHILFAEALSRGDVALCGFRSDGFTLARRAAVCGKPKVIRSTLVTSDNIHNAMLATEKETKHGTAKICKLGGSRSCNHPIFRTERSSYQTSSTYNFIH